MPEAVLDSRDPAKVRAGALGAAKRWGNPANRRIIRMAELEPEEQAVIRSLLALKARRAQRGTPQAA